jgi:hypothetical protein
VATRVCDACLLALPVDGAGVSLMTDTPGERLLLGGSDTVAKQVEDLQFSLGNGPCVTAYKEAHPVLIADLWAREVSYRWPMFAEQVRAVRVRGLFAFPLQLGSISIGALNLHRNYPGTLQKEGEALMVADAVTTALVNSQFRAPFLEAEIFDVSWSTHAEVHQATGTVAAQLEISVAEALARLRAYAFRVSRPLHALARDVLNGTVDLADDH